MAHAWLALSCLLLRSVDDTGALTPTAPACKHTVAGLTFDLEPLRGVVLNGADWPPAGRGHGSFNLSICGDLQERCRDSLTGVAQPPGMLYTMFEGELAGTCWDVIARWEHFVEARALPAASGAKGLVLAFRRAGDAHISCGNVTAEVALRCDASAAQPALAGAQTGCDWSLVLTTASPAVCRPAVAAVDLIDVQAPPPAGKPTDADGASSCVVDNIAALNGCIKRVAEGSTVLLMELRSSLKCRGGTQHACMDLTAPRFSPLMVTGATAQARLHRTNYSKPLLDVAGHSRLVLRRLTFEDASWPSCYPKLQPPGPSTAMVSIGGAAGLVVENCTFLRGHKVAVGLSGNQGVVFSSNVWMESQTFGVWTAKDTNDAVHFFNNQFLRGRNNAIIGVLSGSILQGNNFVYNHHVACFNQSGGQMCLNNARDGRNRAVMTFSSNRVVDGVITGGEGENGQNPGPPGGLTSQAFELNAGIQIRLLHNDLWNNSGWSIIPNARLWPGNASVTVEANRMCSHRSAQPNGSTIGGDPAVQSEWLHIVGDRNCEADNFRTPGKICADVECQPPIRPRGGIHRNEPATTDERDNGELTLSWWAADVAVGSVRVLRDFNLSGVPSPLAAPESVRGLNASGVAKLTPRRSLAEGGELIALHARGFGVLDVTFVATNALPPAKTDDDVEHRGGGVTIRNLKHKLSQLSALELLERFGTVEVSCAPHRPCIPRPRPTWM
jgi:hypothetical protein